MIIVLSCMISRSGIHSPLLPQFFSVSTCHVDVHVHACKSTCTYKRRTLFLDSYTSYSCTKVIQLLLYTCSSHTCDFEQTVLYKLLELGTVYSCTWMTVVPAFETIGKPLKSSGVSFPSPGCNCSSGACTSTSMMKALNLSVISSCVFCMRECLLHLKISSIIGLMIARLRVPVPPVAGVFLL